MPDQSNLRWRSCFFEHAVCLSGKGMGQEVEAHFSQDREKWMLSYPETFSVKNNNNNNLGFIFEFTLIKILSRQIQNEIKMVFSTHTDNSYFLQKIHKLGIRYLHFSLYSYVLTLLTDDPLISAKIIQNSSIPQLHTPQHPFFMIQYQRPKSQII